MQFHGIVPDIPSSVEPENILDKFLTVKNYGKLFASVIDTVGFLSFLFLQFYSNNY